MRNAKKLMICMYRSSHQSLSILQDYAVMVLRTGQAATKLSAPRLPPLPKLRVRKVNAGANSNPCLGLMSSVLGQ